MAIIQANIDNNIIRVLLNREDEDMFGDAPDATVSLDVDFSVNPQIAEGLKAFPKRFLLTQDGVLLYNNTPVSIVEDSLSYVEEKSLKDFYTRAETEIEFLTAAIDSWDTLTPTQKQNYLLNDFDRIMRELRELMIFSRVLMREIWERL